MFSDQLGGKKSKPKKQSCFWISEKDKDKFIKEGGTINENFNVKTFFLKEILMNVLKCSMYPGTAALSYFRELSIWVRPVLVSSGDVDVGHTHFSREILYFPLSIKESCSQDTDTPSAGAVCLPIQTYTDCFPVENLYRRGEMAHSFDINLSATAWPLGQLPGQMPNLWADRGIAPRYP